MTDLDPRYPHRSRRYCVPPSPVLQPDQMRPTISIGAIFGWLVRLIVATTIAGAGVLAILFLPLALIPIVIVVGLFTKASRRSTAIAVQRAVRQELDRRDAIVRTNNAANTREPL